MKLLYLLISVFITVQAYAMKSVSPHKRAPIRQGSFDRIIAATRLVHPPKNYADVSLNALEVNEATPPARILRSISERIHPTQVQVEL